MVLGCVNIQVLPWDWTQAQHLNWTWTRTVHLKSSLVRPNSNLSINWEKKGMDQVNFCHQTRMFTIFKKKAIYCNSLQNMNWIEDYILKIDLIWTLWCKTWTKLGFLLAEIWNSSQTILLRSVKKLSKFKHFTHPIVLVLFTESTFYLCMKSR